MKLVLFAFIQILLLQNIHTGVVKNVLDTDTGENHDVKDDFVSNRRLRRGVTAYSVLDTQENENVIENIVDSFKETVESVNNHVKEILSTDGQRSSREACTHTRHGEANNWPRHSHHKNKPTAREEFRNSYEHNKETEYDSAEKLSKSTYEYSSTDTANHKDSWNSDKRHYYGSTFSDTPSSSSVYNNQNQATVGSNLVFDYNDKKNVHKNEVTSVSNINLGFNSGPIVAENDNVASLDQIVFPGKVNDSTPKTCPEGLVIAANGDCLEPIVIHMGNATTSGYERGVARSSFVAGCMIGYSRSVDGQCVETIYD